MQTTTNYVYFFLLCLFTANISLHAQQIPDPDQGLRAEWMRGSYGMLWLPERNFNGNIEGIRIDEFITQIKDIRTVDYVQLPLTSPNIFSPIHVGPHSLIESFWEGDTDENGDPINLAVPRESVDDPLLSWLKALRAAGLKAEIYVNSYNLLARIPEDTQEDYPDVSERWMEWCDTNPEAQAFIASQDFHEGDGRRKYMFCYAEFILKEYANRYGDLIDAWCFDSADNIMEGECGDDPASDDIDDQRIYQAFAEACHSGNPKAAISFNNSVGDREGNPFTTATYFDDYTFGHPFGGAGNMVENETLYGYNFGVIEWMDDYNGSAFLDDDRTWNDNVVSHYFPKQSATSWNAGNTPCLTDDQFVEWTSKGIIDGGAITWGTPLIRTNLENSPVLTLRDYAVTQFELTDAYLKEFQSPGAPNWSRQYTILPPAYLGQTYAHTLVEGVDFWDPEQVGITNLTIASGTLPEWLTITETEEGVWALSGTPTESEATDYTFEFSAQDADGTTNREVELQVMKLGEGFIDLEDGTPVWFSNPLVLDNAIALSTYTGLLETTVDVFDFEDDALTITKISGPEWLVVTDDAQGLWRLSGIPTAADAGENSFIFSVSDGVLSSETEIKIIVDHVSGFTDLGDGTPVWSASTYNLPDANATFAYNYTLELGKEYYDFEGDALTITKVAGPDWLTIQETSTRVLTLSGTPINTDEGENSITLNLSDGVNSSNTELILTVIPTEISDSNVQIKAAANTNYGINTVATMYSETLTAPDGMATFRISIDVTPTEPFAITSGASGGDSTENSWGMGDGSTTNQETLFRGSDNQAVENINNIQIIDFDAHGGSISEEDITGVFKSITLVNAQNANDLFSITVESVVSTPRAALEATETIDLATETGLSDDTEITEFIIGTANDATANRWSVDGITVYISVDGYTLSSPDLYLTEGFRLYPNPATHDILLNMPIYSARIMDITGKVVKVYTSETQNIDVSQLSEGVYFLKGLNNLGETLVKKFVKRN
ncbi:T9SS type A sorting domain-containing protein [Formosa algae]|uniref:T9SS type A sorting domain-containing protein n=1 Tax=Formosa algae TaxID=225843 RepID=UPI000CCE7D21|nr:putative Ig domain-containing protein [Formosa algae]PNW29675.1 hypothetical protein BKP44_02920 [Formosa algae]